MGIKGYTHQIQDSRQVKRPTIARLLFSKERFDSGAMRGIGIVEAQKLISREWSELSEGEKQVSGSKAGDDFFWLSSDVFSRDILQLRWRSASSTSRMLRPSTTGILPRTTTRKLRRPSMPILMPRVVDVSVSTGFSLLELGVAGAPTYRVL